VDSVLVGYDTASLVICYWCVKTTVSSESTGNWLPSDTASYTRRTESLSQDLCLEEALFCSFRVWMRGFCVPFMVKWFCLHCWDRAESLLLSWWYGPCI
jgi:hypothetical protein